MNNEQATLLAVFLPLTILILILNNIYPDAFFVSFLKQASIIGLFLASLLITEKFPEQKILTVALFFNTLGDLLLFFGQIVLGMISFILAYLCLIVICQKQFKLTSTFFIVTLIVLTGLIPLFIFLTNDLKINLIFIILFGTILVYMVWSSIYTLFNAYYAEDVSFRFAAAGILIFISDIAVAVDYLKSTSTVQNNRWLRNIIWGTYIPAWTLITLNAAENWLYMETL